jgi:hypothetical protein
VGSRERAVRADYDRVMPWLENAMDRMPIFAELGIKRETCMARSATRRTATR